ncbi:uncharacterized protein LOC120184386 [Hibiscus syriacus]|uniref:uncharacterized protein LOC120184386 n=1 Tax=Hibiscus syriacus TaxID=106335 RepID=UPI0019233325|nr:uncharacterized protein LOC120184386 [Hibiscus syriacus]
MKIVSFWNTLERIGFKHFVYELQQLSDSSLFSLAKDSVLCLQCLYSSSQQIFLWLRLDFHEMNKLVSQEILLGFLVKNRESIKRMIKGFEGGKVEWEDKTLFMTFSRGHPVSNKEIHGFIVGKFGSCGEAICMDKNPKWRLFACVVLRSHSDMSRILGGQKLVQKIINGKQARVRRVVPKNILMKTS